MADKQKEEMFRRHPLIVLAIGAMLISLAPILVKAAGRSGLGPGAIGMWRCGLGALMVLALAGIRRTSLRVEPGVLGLLALAGLAFAADLFVWHRSILLAGAGMATILANTQVFATAGLSRWLFGERLSGRFLFAAAGGLLGVILLVGLGSNVTFTTRYRAGVLFGLATAIAYATFLVLLRTAGRRHSPGTSGLARLFWFSAFGAVFLLLATLTEPQPAVPADPWTWLFLVLLALFAQSFGWFAISESLPHVRGAVAGLVLLLQPVLATVWGALVFGESLAALQIAGALLTLGAIYAGSTAMREPASRAAKSQVPTRTRSA